MDMDIFKLTFKAILLFGPITIVFSGTVQRIYIKDNKIPVKGGDIQIVCEVSQFTNEVVRVYKTDTLPQDITTAIPITQCIPPACLGTVTRHTFSPSSSGITITVTSLNRAEDQKYWTCAINNQGRKNVQLTVYTITPSLQYDNPPSKDQDLVQNQVTLKCSTGCAYPSPNFAWYYSKTSGSRQEWSTTAPETDRTAACTDSEKIYTSTLTLSRYTQFTDNTDTTVEFQCGVISISGAENQRFTHASVNVRFAVRVSTVTLNNGNSIASNSLEVNSGEPHTLTCTSSVSRPTATIIWYFGGQEKKRETTRTSSFTFTPEYSDNQKQVYCKAFNIQSENQDVSSNIVALYVKVKVANVTLKDGNTIPSGTLELTNDVSKTMTCTSSESRPTATIIWYIGDDEKKRETVTLSTFTFTPVISDHNKQVYCKTSQSGNPDVFSNRISLYVIVLATTPTITDLTTEKVEGDKIKHQCTSSQTRPVAIVRWKLDTRTLTDVQNTEHSHGNDLKSVTSIVTFTAKRTDNNKTINCETAIPGQNVVKVQEKMTVYWPPSSPVISTSSFPFLEGQTGKSIYCSSSDYGNPTATATWTTQYGTPDVADTRKLRLPVLTYQVDRSPVKCQLKNLFTQKKGLQFESKKVLLQVEYSPRVQIMANGKQVTTITRNEGETLSVTCGANGNPTPIVSWVGQQSRSPTLSFDDIDRKDHGNYTCRATATSTHYPSHNFVTEEILAVVVNYPPDVIVDVNSSNPTENQSFTIKCKPEGRPAEYHFTSFIQKWGSVVIPNTNNLKSNGIMKIENTQLQDSGTYICKANNGIPDRNQQLDQSGNTTVNIMVSPKVLLQTTERKFVGQFGLTTNITVPFYCNPQPRTVQFKFQNGSVITNSSKHTVRFIKGHVKDIFYGQQVELDGYFAQLEIKNVDESDFVNYTLVIDNGIGSYKSWIIDHIYENKPDVPRHFILAKQLSTESSFTVTWTPGNDNGHQQTFILKYKKVSDDEWNIVSVSNTGEYVMTYTVTGLSSGTYYEIVLYASNMLGNSEESEIILAKTKGKANVQICNSGVCNNDIKAVIVGIVLGIINVVVVTYAGYVTILLRRKGENTAGNNSDKPAKVTKNNVPLYTNMVFSTNDGDDQQETDPDESGGSQYTSLKTELKADRQTYDVLGV